MLARASFDVTHCRILATLNARADARCHTPRREHFSMHFEETRKTQGFSPSRAKCLRGVWRRIDFLTALGVVWSADRAATGKYLKKN
jgi:hypothetical protein